MGIIRNLTETLEAEPFLTVEDLCQWWKVSQVMVYKMVREGAIPYIRLGKCVRFAPAEIRAWLQERKCRELRMPRKLRRPPDEQS